MPRLNALADVLFPVEMRPVFAGPNGTGSEPVSVADQRALVDAERQRVLSIVSRDYRLVTNRQALDWALQCCQTVFAHPNGAAWEVTTLDAPSTGGHCF